MKPQHSAPSQLVGYTVVRSTAATGSAAWHPSRRALAVSRLAVIVGAFAPSAVGQQLAPPSARAAIASEAPTSATAQSTVGPIRYQLSNGLTVILEERHGVPQIATRMIVGAGRREQPPGHTGLAHMLEHLMFERTAHGSADFSTLVEALGAIEVNGETSDTETVYHAVIPAHRLEEMLWLESDRLGFLLQRLDQPTLDAQRRVVQSEHRERVDDVAGGFFMRFVAEAWFPVGHPQRDVFEHPEDVAAIRLNDLRWFFQRWYVPANVTLVLVGDFNTAQARAWIERYFGSLANSPVPARSAASPVTITAERRIVVEAPAGNRVLIRWPTPAALSAGDADATLAAFVLSGTTHSRLDRRLVDELDIASSITATQASDNQSGTFTISVFAGDEHTNDELMPQLDAAIALLRTQPIAQAEFDRAKRRVIEHVRREGLNLDARCEQLGSYRQFEGRSVDVTSLRVAQLSQSTPQSVLAFARQWLAPEHRLVAFLRQTYREERRGVLARAQIGDPARTAWQAHATQTPVTDQTQGASR